MEKIECIMMDDGFIIHTLYYRPCLEQIITLLLENDISFECSEKRTSISIDRTHLEKEGEQKILRIISRFQQRISKEMEVYQLIPEERENEHRVCLALTLPGDNRHRNVEMTNDQMQQLCAFWLQTLSPQDLRKRMKRMLQDEENYYA